MTLTDAEQYLYRHNHAGAVGQRVSFFDGVFGNTILNVQLTNTIERPRRLSLRSLVIGALLDGAGYVVCDSVGANGNLEFHTISAPHRLEWGRGFAADSRSPRLTSRRRGGISPNHRSSGRYVRYVVSFCQRSFLRSSCPVTRSQRRLTNQPANNLVFAPNASPTPFLAIVSNGTTLLTAGTVQLQTAPAAGNDLIANAKLITASSFTDFIDTSASNPQEILSGTGAGGETVNQSDPIPQDPVPPNTGATNCTFTWTNRNRHVVFRSVWYKFSVASASTVTIRTDGSRYDTGLYVFPVGFHKSNGLQ